MKIWNSKKIRGEKDGGGGDGYCRVFFASKERTE
jgi:hypothetical protein